MAEPHNATDRPTPRPGSGLFADRPLPSAPAPAEPLPPPGSHRGPGRWLVPLVLFVLIVGGIAWMLQNVPSWRTAKTTAPTPAAAEATQFLEFELNNTVWEKPDGSGPAYIREFERGEEGRYWYPFRNITDTAVELTLLRTNCDCARIDVSFVPEAAWREVTEQLRTHYNPDPEESPDWQWHTVYKDEAGVQAPAGAFGLMRMIWVGRKEPGTPLNLGAELAARSLASGNRQTVRLFASAMIRRPLEAMPSRVDLGRLGPRDTVQGEFFLWSPTRDEVDVTVTDPLKDPLLQIATIKLNDAECAAHQRKLRAEGINTKVRCGYLVKTTLIEQKGERQLDQGPLYRTLAVDIDNAVGEIPPLALSAIVKGDVQVGVAEDQGKVQLKSFRAADGTRKTLALWTDTKTELVYEGHTPRAVEVKLTEDKKHGTAGRRKWLLDVIVPPNQHFGAFDEDHAILLRTNATPPRRIRIPLAGNAVQG